jgi:hypothetical protein
VGLDYCRAADEGGDTSMTLTSGEMGVAVVFLTILAVEAVFFYLAQR